MERKTLHWTAMVGALALFACAESPERHSRMELTDDAVVLRYGRAESSNPEDVLSSVVDAALSESGRYLAILDRQPPFVRLIDLQTEKMLAYGERGSGPGELRQAWSMDFLGDTVLAILNGGRLERFSLRGEWRGGARLVDSGILPMAYTTACHGEGYVYGVARDQTTAPSAAWLHLVNPSSGELTGSVLSIPGVPGENIRYGARIGLDGTDEGVWVWHMQLQSGVQAGYWVPCSTEEPHMLDHTKVSGVVAEAFRVGSTMAMTYTLPDTAFGGAAAQSEDLVLRAFSWSVDKQSITALRAIGDECAEVELLEKWALQDMRSGLVVLSQFEPIPQVVVVRLPWIVERLRKVQCE